MAGAFALNVLKQMRQGATLYQRQLHVQVTVQELRQGDHLCGAFGVVHSL